MPAGASSPDRAQQQFTAAAMLQQVRARFSHHNRHLLGKTLVKTSVARHPARDSPGVRGLTLFLNPNTQTLSHYDHFQRRMETRVPSPGVELISNS